jgi:GR25 family glycosyltransferase involved in LPS biosynthesis
MRLNEYFDKAFCINLDRRNDRWEEVQPIFQRENIEIERFSACDGNKEFNLPIVEGGPASNAELGGAKSHMDVIVKAKELGLKNVLVFEDDVDLIPNINEEFSKVLGQIPDDWDMIYFGGNHVGGLLQFSPNVCRAGRTYALQMYAVRDKFYDLAIKYYSDKIKWVLSGRQPLKPSVAADYFIADLHQIINCYVIKPHFSWQRKSYSDLAENVVYYDFLKENKI